MLSSHFNAFILVKAYNAYIVQIARSQIKYKVLATPLAEKTSPLEKKTTKKKQEDAVAMRTEL